MEISIQIRRNLGVSVSVAYMYHQVPRRWVAVGYRGWNDGAWKEVKGKGNTLETALSDFVERYNKTRKP